MRYYTVEIDGAEKVAVSENGKELYILPQFADMNELIAKGGVAQIPEDAGKVVIPEDAQAESTTRRTLWRRTAFPERRLGENGRIRSFSRKE